MILFKRIRTLNSFLIKISCDTQVAPGGRHIRILLPLNSFLIKISCDPMLGRGAASPWQQKPLNSFLIKISCDLKICKREALLRLPDNLSILF